MSRYICIFLGLLACLALFTHSTSAFPQEDPDAVSTSNSEEIDYYDYVTEDELDENDLDQIAEEIAEGVNNAKEDEGPFARGKWGKGLKVAKGGLKKGPKKVGGAVLTAGQKSVKVSGKGIKIAGKAPKKVAKTSGKELLKGGGKKVGKGGSKVGGKVTGKGGKGGLKVPGKGGSKVGGKVTGKGGKGGGKARRPNRPTKKGKKSWENMKKKNDGNKDKAATKLLKTVAKQILEEGASLAIEAVTPLIIEYILEKTQEGLCSCENTTCGCCAQPPGFDKACLIVKIRPRKKIMNAAITYSGEELANINITTIEGESACTKLTGVASFIQSCIAPIGIGEFDDGFRGCLDIHLDTLSLERSMCVDFKGTRQNGTANWVPPDEIDAIELEAEEAEEEEE